MTRRMIRTVQALSLAGLICSADAAVADSLPPTAEPPSTEPVGAGMDEGFPGSLSINVGIFSDYSFRGVSQTKESWATQGGIDWSHDSGFFVGFWGSRVNFGSGDDAYMEQDYYAGYAGSIGSLGYDVGAYYFYYPRSGALNYWEYAVNTSYDLGFATLKLGGLYSPNYFGALGDAYYASTGFELPIGVELPLGLTLAVDGTIGVTKAERDILSDDRYMDWNLGLVVGGLPMGFALDLRYVDTDENDIDIADSRFVAGLSMAMDF